MEMAEQYRHYRIADIPQHERPRERLEHYGSEQLKTEELLAIVLRSGPQGMSTLELSRLLLARFNHSLAELANASLEELQRVKGIGPAKATELKATFAIADRLMQCRIGARPRIRSPEEAANYVRERFRGKQQEELWALLLDTRSQLLRFELITVGLVDRSQAHAREVFRKAIQINCKKIILIHNHPSGDPTPSPADKTTTTELVAAGEIVDIRILDHIIVGAAIGVAGCDYYSFREHELI